MIGEEGKKMDDPQVEFEKALHCLALAVDESVHKDIMARWRAYKRVAPSPGSAARPELEKLVHAVEVAYLNIWEAKFRGVNMDGLEEQHAKSRARLLAAYPGSAATGQPQAQAEGGAE